ncbi:hypothetical protein TanjilG_29800 [Lupinus angustifolius]|uniref:VQ domain-containing protein n=1 Tax=Lupinus angustifolius TaxID=3871 RepID=A0A394DDL2_LUPAN|nr:PREDICTED: VQ motif-containing protein 1-like [Lupinus angustifolius]OIW21144.1 hypothetical protein TanjilG_29800 [Lupinus angustifolius]
MENGGCRRKPVKIVIINTQYVETDAMNFKSVVQKLTGKHSCSDDVEVGKAKRVRHNGVVSGVEVPCSSDAAHGSSFSISDFSLSDFDMLLAEMPLINGNMWSH